MKINSIYGITHSKKITLIPITKNTTWNLIIGDIIGWQTVSSQNCFSYRIIEHLIQF